MATIRLAAFALADQSLELLNLELGIVEARRPGLRAELSHGFRGGGPLFFVHLGSGQAEQTGRFQGAEPGDLAPLLDCVGPAVLAFADFGQHGVAFGFASQHLDDGSVCPFRLALFA